MEFKEIIKYAPEIFRLFVNLRADSKVSEKSKHFINTVIAYFIAPFEVIPEKETGPWGYLDDLFLSSLTLKKLENEIGYEALEKNWDGDEDLKEIVKRIYETAKGWLDGMEDSIITQAGLSKKDFRGIK
jgi:uncharacterized membrane protein YkvA (DUF1232 family)